MIGTKGSLHRKGPCWFNEMCNLIATVSGFPLDNQKWKPEFTHEHYLKNADFLSTSYSAMKASSVFLALKGSAGFGGKWWIEAYEFTTNGEI